MVVTEVGGATETGAQEATVTVTVTVSLSSVCGSAKIENVMASLKIGWKSHIRRAATACLN